MNIAIVGLGPTCEQAPFDDPEWQCWGMAWSHHAPRCNLVFEMHEPIGFGEFCPAGYEDRLKESDVPVVMQSHDGRFPCAPYPFEMVRDQVLPPMPDGKDYLGSSVAYMLALALTKKPGRIGIWGVDADEEYAYQRANIMYFVGVANGRGIEIVLPEDCTLFDLGEMPRSGSLRYGFMAR